MGHLQKTPVGLARRILNFEDESLPSPLGTKVVLEAKALVTAEYPIQTICEAAEASIPSKPIAESSSQSAPTNLRRQPSKPAPEANRSSKSDGASSSRIANIKPKPSPVWKVGKASKNAVNSEVQSLSLAHKVPPQSLPTHKVQSQSISHKGPPSCSSLRSQPSQTQSWAQRIQNVPASQQQSRSKSIKSEPPKVTVKPLVARHQTPVPAVVPLADLDDGWETVRGRTRSRTSPGKATPVLTRASTMVYGSRLEAARQSNKANSRQQQSRSGLLKPSTAQSLPSLCDREPQSPVLPKQAAPISPPIVIKELTPPVANLSVSQSSVNDDKSIIVSSDDDKDEAEEAAEVAKEEAEMARREEALTLEEENLQREMRETERSDNEGDETWEDPINVTPVCFYCSVVC